MRKVNQIDSNGNIVNTYPSITEASLSLSGKTSLISQICLSIKSGGRRKSGGYSWAYAQ